MGRGSRAVLALAWRFARLPTTGVFVLSAGCSAIIGADFDDKTLAPGGSGGATTGSTGSSPGCPTIMLSGEADRAIVVRQMASVDVTVSGTADQVHWEQTHGPEVLLPADGAMSFSHTPPYVHDTIGLKISALRQGCNASSVDVELTPFASLANRIFVSASTGDDANMGTADAPLKTIGKAVMSATANTSVIVGAGDYVITQPLAIPDSVQLFGGYDSAWHRSHHTSISRIELDHAFMSPTTPDTLWVLGCGTGACTIGGFTVELKNTGGTGEGITAVIRVGSGGATIYENDIVRCALSVGEYHAALGITDTVDFMVGGAGPMQVFDNVIEGGNGSPVVGIMLWQKADPLSEWTVASNYIQNFGGGSGDDSTAVYMNGSVSLVGNTFHIKNNDVAAQVADATVFGNLLRGVDGGTQADGLACTTMATDIESNGIYGFTAPYSAGCVNVMHLLNLDPLMDGTGHLMAGSPAIDWAPSNVAATALLPMWDRDGDLRIKGMGVDVGADEVK